MLVTQQGPAADDEARHLVVFGLSEARHALDLASVERVIPAVEVTPLPRAPAAVRGIVDIAGDVVPVVCMRQRFGQPADALQPSQQLIIARTSRRRVALLVDEVHDVVRGGRVPLEETAMARPLAGVVRLPDGLVLIHDLEAFLCEDEARQLDDAMSAHR
jgi:purine-binding chemotaxis protein CheW